MDIMDIMDMPTVTYAHSENRAVRFQQFAADPLPAWAVDVQPGKTLREKTTVVKLVSDERLLEMAELLEAMCPKTKAPSDGLGIYMGDGMPRPKFKNDHLRSRELSECLRELLVLRQEAAANEHSQDRMWNATRDLLGVDRNYERP